MTPLSWDQDHARKVPSQSWSPEISSLNKAKAWVQVSPLLSASRVTLGTLPIHYSPKYIPWALTLPQALGTSTNEIPALRRLIVY